MMRTIALCQNDPANAVAAIREAAARLIEMGIPLWSLDELNVQALRKKYPDSDFLSFWLGEALAGGVIITKEAPAYWPAEISEKHAIYINKLSVRDEFVGRQISSQIMELIHEHYGQLGFRTARLDCDAERSKLNEIYLDMSYQLIHHDIVLDRYPTNFYERAISTIY